VQPQAAYAPAAAPVAGTPVPPDMHWVLVWLLAAVTFGIFGLVWIFKQVGFVQRIDPASKAKMLFSLGLLAVAAQIVLMVVGVVMRSMAFMAIMGMVGMLLYMGAIVCWLIAIFGMRTSLIRYYNTVEPIGLQLSGVMTFFFTFLYFQYHFSRIAEWKRTGQLR
jgi:hypothetical protein